MEEKNTDRCYTMRWNSHILLHTPIADRLRKSNHLIEGERLARLSIPTPCITHPVPLL